MSREVRRVPVGWQHPTQVNPHWTFQQQVRRNMGRATVSLLLPSGMMFTPLYGQAFSVALAEWQRERAEWEAGTHSSLLFSLKYHAEGGYLNDDGTHDEPRPLKVYDDDGETIVLEFFPTTVDEIKEHETFEDYTGGEPKPEDFMPDFDVPEAERGWCLYETVSEGCPTTPVFATAAELIEHLCTVGEDYDQKPYRREAAERLVGDGSSMGSFVKLGGEVLNSSRDADLIAKATS